MFPCLLLCMIVIATGGFVKGSSLGELECSCQDLVASRDFQPLYKESYGSSATAPDLTGILSITSSHLNRCKRTSYKPQPGLCNLQPRLSKPGAFDDAKGGPRGEDHTRS